VTGEDLILGLCIVAAGFIPTVILTWPLVGWLRRRQLGKSIRVDGPDHASKSGTPTMGGLAMLAVIALWGLVIVWVVGIDRGQLSLTIVTMAAFAGLGLMDDWRGLRRRSAGRDLGVGLTARRMFGLQLLVATATGLWFLALCVPRLIWVLFGPRVPPGASVALGTGMLVLWVVAIVGTANGVNIADGLDGLAAGLAAIAFGALAITSTIWYGTWPNSMTVMAQPLPGWHLGGYPTGAQAGLALIASGACLGFLVFNRHPAKVFMGNVASLALGAGLASLALNAPSRWLLVPAFVLPVIGAVFVAEVLSDIIQVAYFKATGGKRIFRMAPLHHHFELGGWSETKVVHRFWFAGMVAGLIGVALVALVWREPPPFLLRIR
jgi:phospho-N-acetylmuramoyl-pentapeptide-transferase